MKKTKQNISILIALLSTVIVLQAQAQVKVKTKTVRAKVTLAEQMDELDPADPNIQQKLKAMDAMYFQQTGQSPFLPKTLGAASCMKFDCPVYVLASKSKQRMKIYVNGALTYEWLMSSGGPGHETPLWSGHPNGRIYDAYSSKANPGGDYKGLGNMPYAVFLVGGYAIHGTTEGNFKKLGTPASHGCLRLHPDNAKIFNRLVRKYGAEATYVDFIK